MKERDRKHRKHHQNNRSGYEFSAHTKYLARERSGGYCEYPRGCDNPHDDTVDHFTGIFLGRLLGMDHDTIVSLDNAQMLCKYHDRRKTMEETHFQNEMMAKLTRNQLQYRLGKGKYKDLIKRAA